MRKYVSRVLNAATFSLLLWLAMPGYAAKMIAENIPLTVGSTIYMNNGYIRAVDAR